MDSDRSDDASYFTYDDDAGDDDDVEVVEKINDEVVMMDDNCDDYEIMSPESVAEEMEKCVSEVSSVANMPKTATRALLVHFEWDKEKLFERYFADGDPGKLFVEARVASPFEGPGSAGAWEKNSGSGSSATCRVCSGTVDASSLMLGSRCGHLFCVKCWGQYLATKVTSRGATESITCAAYECGTLVDYETIVSLLKSPGDRAKYQRLAANSFVESSKLYRWCPSPGCDRAVKVQSSAPQRIKCSECNHAFCFSCGEGWHEPLSCAHLRKWLRECSDSKLMTTDWLVTSIMTRVDSGHRCSRLAPPSTSWRSRQAARERYLFCSKRYASHRRSLMLEGRLYRAMEAKMRELVEEHRLSWADVGYLGDAVDVLRHSRQTLSHAYVFAYYVSRNNQTLIFEDNLNDLHRAVESLSELLEREIVHEDYQDIKVKVSDACRYCEDRRKTLLRHVREGSLENWWEFSDS